MRTPAALLLLTLLLATASCKRTVDVAGNQNAAGNNAHGANTGTSSTPPFATREAERYQALRVTTSSGGTGAAGTESSQTFIARDGNRRRENYTLAGEKFSRLELPEGIYLLLPSKKLYAELKTEPGRVDGEREAATLPPDFSPEKLLNEERPESVYEKLGEETLNGRAAVKYRVTVRGKTGAGLQATTESVVWVDESLGMPVKTETTSIGGAADGARMTMELRDLKETVDAAVFELPPDYRRVEARELFAQR
ncbi:MAG TPA: hypothetical protein VJT09_00905 [Pyrinomonadaceae bacterium]|nr:hypothetical protein [Pyrinomonadaceae bacterium]